VRQSNNLKTVYDPEAENFVFPAGGDSNKLPPIETPK